MVHLGAFGWNELELVKEAEISGLEKVQGKKTLIQNKFFHGNIFLMEKNEHGVLNDRFLKEEEMYLKVLVREDFEFACLK